MDIEADPFEDRPLPEGVELTDWTGMVWKEIPKERAAFLMRQNDPRGKLAAFLAEISVGEGRKRENLPDFRAARQIRNSLYRAAKKVWGTNRSSNGKNRTSIKVHITRIYSEDLVETYTVEFVHLAPEKE